MHSAISVDVGGTFTDVTAVFAEGKVLSSKVLSTPDNYARGILEGIKSACGAGPYPAHVVIHGMTVATNAVLSRKGLGRAALVTTQGFGDILTIGTGRRSDLYNIDWDKPLPVIARDRIFEVAERVDSKGTIVAAPSENDMRRLAEAIKAAKVNAVAVSLINAYANSANERTLVEYLRAAGCAPFVFAATDLTCEIREFERTSTAVLNAVLLEPVHGYLNALTDLFTQNNASGFLVIQSNGGLLPAKTAANRPVALLESGPAAGILGAAQLASALKLDKVIAFDMGGTTAKACLIENGEPQEAAEYEVGGAFSTASPLVRGGGYAVRLPCLELCEVGAGGGSIAWIDDVGVLRLGPQSAGSYPGPACYGLGGNLPTVADAQVVLGYLPSTLGDGAVTVDRSLARRAIASLADRLSVSIEEAALAVFDLANTIMGRALRAVSIERGRDPADYTLVAFGGSGPLHAIAIAKELGIGRVVIPPFSGVFSSLAMMTADLRLDAVTSIQLPLTAATPQLLERSFESAENELLREFQQAGVLCDRIHFSRTLDVRYSGQASWLSTRAPAGMALEQIQTDFEAQYSRLFGHTSPDDVVEVVALRVRATIPGPQMDRVGMQRPENIVRNECQVYLSSLGWRPAGIVNSRDYLANAGQGTIIIAEKNATILVPEGCRASVGNRQEIVVDVEQKPMPATAANELSLEILRHRFEAIVDEMGILIPKTARSIIVREAHDFATALCSPKGEVICQSTGMLIHAGSFPYTMRALLDRFADEIRPGDVYITNDPYEGGSHLPDFFIAAPIFLKEELLAFAIVSSHQSDVGGGIPGGFAAGARDIFQEGMIIPFVRLMRDGQVNEDVWRIVTRNTRTPRNVAGDVRAVLAACRKADEEVRVLATDMGAHQFLSASQDLIEYAEKLTRVALRKLPQGTWTATDYLDDDGRGNPIRVSVELHIANGHVRADFSNSDPQMPNSFNANFGTLASTVYTAFRCLLNASIPENSGYMRCFDVESKIGTIVNPRSPAATSSRGHTAYRLLDVMFKALASAVPDRIWAASEGGANLMVVSGQGADGPWVMMDAVGGSTGGRPGKDGVAGAASPISNARNNSLEIMERDFPVSFRQFGLVPDTGGTGRWRGANAIVKEIEILTDSVMVFSRNDRRRFRPWGLLGGEEGAPSAIQLRRAGQNEWATLPMFSLQELKRGDRFRITTAGGGGYGRVGDRDAASIRSDLLNGKVRRTQS